jgi:hypothetical protein
LAGGSLPLQREILGDVLKEAPMSRFTKRPVPGTVIATVAWFVALGGVAAALPGKNSVDNGDVKGLKYKDLDFKNTWHRYDDQTAYYPPAAALDAQASPTSEARSNRSTPGDSNFAQLQPGFRPDEGIIVPVVVGGGFMGLCPSTRAGRRMPMARLGPRKRTYRDSRRWTGIRTRRANRRGL